MQRREAIRTLSGIMGAMVALPAWAEKWSVEKIAGPTLLDKGQKMILTSMVDAIIPKTDTPGAAELGVSRFVELMIQDCFETSSQDQLKKGLSNLDSAARTQFGKGFSRLRSSEQLQLIKSFAQGSDQPDRDFVNLVKNLVIQGYTSSEYVMTHITRYELVPARYHGCVSIES